MGKQCKSGVKFFQEKFADSTESSSRTVEGSPTDMTVGDDVALLGSSFIRGVVSRSQAALQEGEVEALTHHDSRQFCVRDMQLPGKAAEGTEGQAYTLHVFAHCSAPRSQPQKNHFFVLHTHRRLLVKAGRNMCQISCSSAFVLVNFYRFRVYVTGYPDLQEKELCRSSYSKAWPLLPDIQTILSSFF